MDSRDTSDDNPSSSSSSSIDEEPQAKRIRLEDSADADIVLHENMTIGEMIKKNISFRSILEHYQNSPGTPRENTGQELDSTSSSSQIFPLLARRPNHYGNLTPFETAFKFFTEVSTEPTDEDIQKIAEKGNITSSPIKKWFVEQDVFNAFKAVFVSKNFDDSTAEELAKNQVVYEALYESFKSNVKIASRRLGCSEEKIQEWLLSQKDVRTTKESALLAKKKPHQYKPRIGLKNSTETREADTEKNDSKNRLPTEIAPTPAAVFSSSSRKLLSSVTRPPANPIIERKCAQVYPTSQPAPGSKAYFALESSRKRPRTPPPVTENRKPAIAPNMSDPSKLAPNDYSYLSQAGGPNPAVLQVLLAGSSKTAPSKEVANTTESLLVKILEASKLQSAGTSKVSPSNKTKKYRIPERTLSPKSARALIAEPKIAIPATPEHTARFLEKFGASTKGMSVKQALMSNPGVVSHLMQAAKSSPHVGSSTSFTENRKTQRRFPANVSVVISQIPSSSTAQLQTSPKSPAQSQVSPKSQAQSQSTPKSQAQSLVSPKSTAQSQFSPRNSNQSQLLPKSPARAQISPRSPAQPQMPSNSSDHLQIPPRSPAQLRFSPRSSNQSQFSPRSPTQAQVSPRSPAQQQMPSKSSSHLQISPRSPFQSQVSPKSSGQSQLLIRSLVPNQSTSESPKASSLPSHSIPVKIIRPEARRTSPIVIQKQEHVDPEASGAREPEQQKTQSASPTINFGCYTRNPQSVRPSARAPSHPPPRQSSSRTIPSSEFLTNSLHAAFRLSTSPSPSTQKHGAGDQARPGRSFEEVKYTKQIYVHTRQKKQSESSSASLQAGVLAQNSGASKKAEPTGNSVQARTEEASKALSEALKQFDRVMGSSKSSVLAPAISRPAKPQEQFNTDLSKTGSVNEVPDTQNQPYIRNQVPSTSSFHVDKSLTQTTVPLETKDLLTGHLHKRKQQEPSRIIAQETETPAPLPAEVSSIFPTEEMIRQALDTAIRVQTAALLEASGCLQPQVPVPNAPLNLFNLPPEMQLLALIQQMPPVWNPTVPFNPVPVTFSDPSLLINPFHGTQMNQNKFIDVLNDKPAEPSLPINQMIHQYSRPVEKNQMIPSNAPPLLIPENGQLREVKMEVMED